MLNIVAGGVLFSGKKARQDRERGRAVKPLTGTRGYGEHLSPRGPERWGASVPSTQAETDQHTPERDLHRELFLPDGGKRFTDHVEVRTRGEREERDEDVLARDRVPDDRAEESRAPATRPASRSHDHAGRTSAATRERRCRTPAMRGTVPVLTSSVVLLGFGVVGPLVAADVRPRRGRGSCSPVSSPAEPLVLRREIIGELDQSKQVFVGVLHARRRWDPRVDR